MRIAVAVVVGVVLLSSGHTVRAAEAPRQRSEACLDSCNFAFEKCQASEGVKPTGRCNINVVRCKNECPYEAVEATTVPTAKSHYKCIDACRATYKACQGRAESKRGGACAADDMRCEKACPKPEPSVAAAAPPAPPTTSGDDSAAAPVAPAAPALEVKSKPRRAARVEGAAAPAPASAPPVAEVGERAGASAPTVRSGAVTPPATAPTEASTAVARPAQSERGFFGRLGCFFVSCEPAGSIPCLEQCATAYDDCHARESKRGGECNTRLMHCRQGCRDAVPAPAR